MSYFIPAANSNLTNKRGQSQATSHYTSSSVPSSSGGGTQPPPPTRYIPPPAGAMQSSGQTVLNCPHCNETLPPGLDLATHLVGCGVAELLTKAYTPFDYPFRPKHTGGQPPNFQPSPPNYNGRSGSRR